MVISMVDRFRVFTQNLTNEYRKKVLEPISRVVGITKWNSAMVASLSLSILLQFVASQTDMADFTSKVAYTPEPSIVDTLARRGVLGLGGSPVPPDLQSKLSLASGQGLVASQPVPGMTAANAGVKQGDIILALNGKPIGPTTLGSTWREIASGSEVTIGIVRDGTPMQLKTTVLEKPRDPGNANYEVIYSHVVSYGNKMRTIITKPKKAGKHPAFFFIQGFSPISYDFKLEGSTGDVATLDGPLLFEFANSDFVTIRVEKPGVGDSEGGPFAPMDYTTELDIYRQTLKQLKSLPEVDGENVFIFGHSMGGAFGPMIACESPVKGIAVYGTASRTWFEYLMDTIRYQSLVGGITYAEADENARKGARLMALVMLEGKSPDEVKKSVPELASEVDVYFPGGLFNGKSLGFWRQLNQINFADYWAKCNAYVFSSRGKSDFVTYDADHQLIVDIINRATPGKGTLYQAPNSDHLFHDFPTEQESMKNFQKGKFNMSFTKAMKKWMLGVIAKKS